jgi:hypothetical protein
MLPLLIRRFAQVRELFSRLRPGVSNAALRRTMHRLRTEAIHSLDPRIPSHVLADLLEGDMLIRSVVADMHELRELEESLGRRSR